MPYLYLWSREHCSIAYVHTYIRIFPGIAGRTVTFMCASRRAFVFTVTLFHARASLYVQINARKCRYSPRARARAAEIRNNGKAMTRSVCVPSARGCSCCCYCFFVGHVDIIHNSLGPRWTDICKREIFVKNSGVMWGACIGENGMSCGCHDETTTSADRSRNVARVIVSSRLWIYRLLELLCY